MIVYLAFGFLMLCNLYKRYLYDCVYMCYSNKVIYLRLHLIQGIIYFCAYHTYIQYM